LQRKSSEYGRGMAGLAEIAICSLLPPLTFGYSF
jgi:hypothetical protein